MQVDLVGRQLGRYRLERAIAEGGMGVVYLGVHVDLGRPVAIKVVKPGTALDESLLRRLKAEARIAATLHHPGIAAVHDIGDDAGFTYLVMDYIAGPDLGTILENEKRLDLPRALDYVEQISLALDYAHGVGIIHRDIKPSNILIASDASTPFGRPVLTDFGIAKAAEASRMTGTAMTLGTPEYLAPEQAQGHPIDGRTDLYSLGVVFYEMITGRLPFEADTPIATALKHITESPTPVTKWLPDVPRPVLEFLGKALAKKPSERFQSGHEMAEAAATIAWRLGIPDALTGRRRQTPRSRLGRVPPKVRPGSEEAVQPFVTCGSCGQPAMPGEKFCRRCGARLPVIPGAAGPPPRPESGGVHAVAPPRRKPAGPTVLLDGAEKTEETDRQARPVRLKYAFAPSSRLLLGLVIGGVGLALILAMALGGSNRPATVSVPGGSPQGQQPVPPNPPATPVPAPPERQLPPAPAKAPPPLPPVAERARIVLVSENGPARFYVDNHYVGAGERLSVTVDPGSRTVRAEKQGYSSATRVVTLAGGTNADLVLRLEPLPQASLEIVLDSRQVEQGQAITAAVKGASPGAKIIFYLQAPGGRSPRRWEKVADGAGKASIVWRESVLTPGAYEVWADEQRSGSRARTTKRAKATVLPRPSAAAGANPNHIPSGTSVQPPSPIVQPPNPPADNPPTATKPPSYALIRIRRNSTNYTKDLRLELIANKNTFRADETITFFLRLMNTTAEPKQVSFTSEIIFELRITGVEGPHAGETLLWWPYNTRQVFGGSRQTLTWAAKDAKKEQVTWKPPIVTGRAVYLVQLTLMTEGPNRVSTELTVVLNPSQ